MFYVTRSASGVIESISRQPQLGAESLDERHSEIESFFNVQGSPQGFDAADANFVRVIEDLIDALIKKNVLCHTDLPEAVQKKLLLRKNLRNRLNDSLDLLGGDQQIL